MDQITAKRAKIGGPKMDPKMGSKMAQNGSFWAIFGPYTGIYRENRGIWPYMAPGRPWEGPGPLWDPFLEGLAGF